jgi:selenocysteine lyase/cysteine desulfurase
MIATAIEPPALHYEVKREHSMPHDMRKALCEFSQQYPAFNALSVIVDSLRQKDYNRLDASQTVYLDYTGSSLYGTSQISLHTALLTNTVYGNPHSDNPASALSSHAVEEARKDVLKYFNADPEEYAVIFTPNATGALRLVGESYPFVRESTLLLTFDCHNSVNGIREFARSKGSNIRYIPIKRSNLRLDVMVVSGYLDKMSAGVPNLFAYPAESNFSGVQHPLEFIAQAQQKGWDVLLDAAAFVPANKLDLSLWHPDFVTISFYKMFGYPTGVGCLIAKHSALSKLKRPWFAGGTVDAVSVNGDGYYYHEDCSAFEDGTLNFLSIAAVPIGLQHIRRVGITAIHDRVAMLTDWLLKKLSSLRHSNGVPVLRLYGPSNVRMRGGIVSMNFQDPDGIVIDPGIVEHEAAEAHISIRAGCFCNPGSIETINNLSVKDLYQFFHHTEPMSFEDYVAFFPGKTMGAVRVSLGIASNFADVYAFVRFAETFIDRYMQELERSCHNMKSTCRSSC